MPITNKFRVDYPLAVWLLHDDYDRSSDPNHISATGLLKSVRQVVLASRVPEGARELDLMDLINARMGTAVHDSVEKAWADPAKGLMTLGVSEKVARRIRLNPTPEEIARGALPVWMERRSSKEVFGMIVSGKFDLVLDGQLHDFKTTSIWSWVFGSKDEDYRLQGSIYRWLNPDIVTKDTVSIEFLFTDFQKREAEKAARDRSQGKSNNYPPRRHMQRQVPLMTLQETQSWVEGKVRAIQGARNLPEHDIPYCTDKELWRSPSKHKYYANPAKTEKATKVFDSLSEAQAHAASEGKGIVKSFPGEARACEYCAAAPICSQRENP